VGSIGLGGIQVLAGLLLVGVALSGPASATESFLLLGLAWLVPGLLLGAGGVGVVLGSRWARRISLAAVIGSLAFLGCVGAFRRSLPPAVADAGEWAIQHPEAPPIAKDLWKKMVRGPDQDNLALLRDPSQAGAIGWAYTAYCGCPVLPWYLVVLLACALPSGRRIAKE
jgi:hypothetical protein